MATQAALIADTIVGLKKALQRENDFTGPDEPITQPTNRGNKLRANAQYVREGALGYARPQEQYKEKINHAGYTRYILRRKPPRYDSEGEEIDEEDEDVEGESAEEDPFADVHIEHILAPLKHPSELPDHPSLSQPYKSKALLTMTQAIEEKLRKERALLWRARNLHRQFLGDPVWMPCGKVETPEDKYIFLERPPAEAPGTTNIGTTVKDAPTGEPSEADQQAQALATGDVEMPDAPNTEPDGGANGKTPKTEDVDTTVKDLPQHQEGNNSEVVANGATTQEDAKPAQQSNTNNGDVDMRNADDTERSRSSLSPPRRMTTRAQANNAPSPEEASTSTEIPSIHPLFLTPQSILPDKNLGLPPAEAEETRRLLWSFIQKQEEIVRGFETMLESLLRACRMKDDVFEWCKAEAHVGEMSDGEDWYDKEKWGLKEDEDLRKGADEDDGDNNADDGGGRTTGKRGRGRR